MMYEDCWSGRFPRGFVAEQVRRSVRDPGPQLARDQSVQRPGSGHPKWTPARRSHRHGRSAAGFVRRHRRIVRGRVLEALFVHLHQFRPRQHFFHDTLPPARTLSVPARLQTGGRHRKSRVGTSRSLSRRARGHVPGLRRWLQSPACARGTRRPRHRLRHEERSPL